MLSIKKHSKLWLYLAGVVFVTIVAVFVIVSVLWLALFELELIQIDPRDRHVSILVFALGSLLLGAVIAIYIGRTIVRPVQRIGNAFGELSKGNFNVKIPENEKIGEIREMAQRFNAMTYDLSHIETLRSDFVANVSHEFKTPIAAIEGYATLLQNRNLSQEKRERYVEKILENARRLSSLSGNVLLLSRLENQEMIPDQTRFRLDEQIRQCVLLLENKWSIRQIEFNIALQRQYFYGSQALLEQVWLNVLDNAIKHSPVGGCIEITLAAMVDKVRISITDHGDGMTQDVQKHIFEKFYQGDSSRRSEGNGLGLALVKRIVDLCDGEITVSSAPDKGTSFAIELPLIQ